MTSPRQIEANRQNALKSTGPKTEEGKRQSRRNALRHGFTAETVIEPLEHAEEYRAFEDAIVSEYLPRTPVEQELVYRLASLFWRLRRATLIDTGFLRIQSEILQSRRRESQQRDGQCRKTDHDKPRPHAERDPYHSVLESLPGFCATVGCAFDCGLRLMLDADARVDKCRQLTSRPRTPRKRYCGKCCVFINREG